MLFLLLTTTTPAIAPAHTIQSTTHGVAVLLSPVLTFDVELELPVFPPESLVLLVLFDLLVLLVLSDLLLSDLLLSSVFPVA